MELLHNMYPTILVLIGLLVLLQHQVLCLLEWMLQDNIKQLRLVVVVFIIVPILVLLGQILFHTVVQMWAVYVFHLMGKINMLLVIILLDIIQQTMDKLGRIQKRCHMLVNGHSFVIVMINM